MPCPSLGDLLNPGFELASLTSPALAGGFFTTSITWEAEHFTWKEEYSTLNQIILLSKCTEYEHLAHQFSSVQFSSVTQSCLTLCYPMDHTACQASLSIINSWSSFELMSIKLVMPSNHLILCHPLLLLPSILPSMRIFSNESVLHIRCPEYRSFSFNFSISRSNEYSGLISFRMDWLDLLAVQGSLKSLLQQHSSKASILQHSALWSNSHIHT